MIYVVISAKKKKMLLGKSEGNEESASDLRLQEIMERSKSHAELHG